MLASFFNLAGPDTLIILNGPITKELGFNYTQGVMRDGFQPNVRSQFSIVPCRLPFR